MDAAEAACRHPTGQGSVGESRISEGQTVEETPGGSCDDYIEGDQKLQEQDSGGVVGSSNFSIEDYEPLDGDTASLNCRNPSCCESEFKSCQPLCPTCANVVNNNVTETDSFSCDHDSSANSDEDHYAIYKKRRAEPSVEVCSLDDPHCTNSPPEESHDYLPKSPTEEPSDSLTSLHLGEQMLFLDLSELGPLEEPLLDSITMATIHPGSADGMPEYRSHRMEVVGGLELEEEEEEDDDDEEEEDLPDLEDSISTVRTVCDTKIRSLSYAWEDMNGDTTGTFSELEEDRLYTVTVKGTVRIGMDGTRLLTCDQQDSNGVTSLPTHLGAYSRNCDITGQQLSSNGHRNCDSFRNLPLAAADHRGASHYQEYSGHHPSFFMAQTFYDMVECSDDGHQRNMFDEMNGDIDDDSEDDTLHFSDLPTEIIRKIFSYFTQAELGLTLALVCKSWCDHAYDPIHWKRLILGYENDMDVAAMKRCIRRAPLVTHINLCWQRSIPLTLLRFMKDQCHMLVELDLGFCDCVDFSFISSLSVALKQLQSLNLEGCTQVNQKCISALGRMPRLCRLNLSHCTMLDDPAVLSLAKNLSSIQALNIDGISAITDESIAALVGLHGPNLEQLDLDGAELTDASIQALLQCTQLQGLAISFAELLTDTALLCIQGMRTLHRLQIKKGADLTCLGLTEMFEARLLTNLRELSLAEATQLEDSGVRAVINCCGQRLTSLSLCWCWNITDIGLEVIIDNCRCLITLDLLGLDKITGSCLKNLPAAVPGLRTLNLQQCNQIIDELIVDIVRQMPKLKATNYYGEEFCHIDKG